MLRTSVTALALVLALAACGPSAKQKEAEAAKATAALVAEQAALSTELNQWFDAKYEEQLVTFSPMQLTMQGRKERNGEIDCFSLACQDEQLAWGRAATEEMKAKFDRAKLSPEDQVSYDIWLYMAEQAEAAVAFRKNGFMFEQMGGAQSFVPTFLISFHAVDSADDAKAWVSRVTASARALREGIAIAKENAAKGTHAPAFAYRGVIDQSQKIITGAPFTRGAPSAIYKDFTDDLAKLVAAGKLTADDASALSGEAQAALTGDFQGAYKELIAFAQADLKNAPDAKKAQGASTQPDGLAYYNFMLAQQTTTKMTANEVHDLGLAEVARIRTEMEAIKTKVGFTGTLEAFFNMMRTAKTDPKFYYPNTDAGRAAYIADATKAIDNIKGKLPDYFGILPKAGIEVRRVEAFREQPGAAQHYYPPTLDGSRPGIYYAHLSDMAAMPKSELEVIAYHEGIPGHHMQIAIAQELQSVPKFRTQINFNAYAEGWALYSEKLATEMDGTFTDPYSDFGRLGSEIWRAIRLVVDTGLHTKGWTEEQAVAYFLANAPTTEAQARSEIQRYIVWPGQATGYKVGMIKIQQLRAKAETELGDKFDIKGFHDTVLGGGAVPLDLLERRVDQWIAQKQAG